MPLLILPAQAYAQIAAPLSAGPEWSALWVVAAVVTLGAAAMGLAAVVYALVVSFRRIH